jgi:hypothetical protein
MGHRHLAGDGAHPRCRLEVGNVIFDWVVIAVVIGLVLVVWFLMLGVVNELVSYWKAYRDARPRS